MTRILQRSLFYRFIAADNWKRANRGAHNLVGSKCDICQVVANCAITRRNKRKLYFVSFYFWFFLFFQSQKKKNVDLIEKLRRKRERCDIPDDRQNMWTCPERKKEEQKPTSCRLHLLPKAVGKRARCQVRARRLVSAFTSLPVLMGP